MITENTIRQKFKQLENHLNERTKRIWAGTEARAIGWGGVSLVARAIKISRRAIHYGLHEIDSKQSLPAGRIRKGGGGRYSAVQHHPDLINKVENLVDPVTRGDPESPLRWTCKSTRILSAELVKIGFNVSSRIVRILLHRLGYSLQGNQKNN